MSLVYASPMCLQRKHARLNALASGGGLEPAGLGALLVGCAMLIDAIEHLSDVEVQGRELRGTRAQPWLRIGHADHLADRVIAGGELIELVALRRGPRCI